MEMRIWVKIAVFALSIGLAQGQDLTQLNRYILTSGQGNLQNAEAKISQLHEKIGSKSKKSDRQFLRNVFSITHRQLLKQYDQYSGFGDLFQTGQYDCLTATALYSLVLSHFGYAHKIIETNYHIFLLVQTDEGEILIESTDPINGFEYQSDRIQARIQSYLDDQGRIAGNESQHIFSYSLFEQVSSIQMEGLLYYNQCVRAFNNQQWIEAGRYLTMAKQHYDSPRTREMENLLLSVIASNELEKSNLQELRATYGAGQIAQLD